MMTLILFTGTVQVFILNSEEHFLMTEVNKANHSDIEKSEAIKREVEMPVMAVGLITGAHQAEAIIAEGRADLLALARGVMDDPRWSWHAAQELGDKVVYPDQYVRVAPDKWPGATSMKSS